MTPSGRGGEPGGLPGGSRGPHGLPEPGSAAGDPPGDPPGGSRGRSRPPEPGPADGDGVCRPPGGSRGQQPLPEPAAVESGGLPAGSRGFTDPAALRDWISGSDERLRTRIETHQRYSRRRDTWIGWLMDLLRPRGTERLLDVGCGSGLILLATAERLPGGAAIGLDLSPGMVASARRAAAERGLGNVRTLVADAQRLPFRAGRFDLAMANHTLFHVPDIDAALAELRRVLRPGGWLLASTNSVNYMTELNRFHAEAARCAGLSLPGADTAGQEGRFSLENGGAYLARHFARVDLFRREDALVFEAPEPLVRFWASGWMYRGTAGPDDPAIPPEGWARFQAAFAEVVAEAIDRGGGRLEIGKVSGAFLCHA